MKKTKLKQQSNTFLSFLFYSPRIINPGRKYTLQMSVTPETAQFSEYLTRKTIIDCSSRSTTFVTAGRSYKRRARSERITKLHVQSNTVPPLNKNPLFLYEICASATAQNPRVVVIYSNDTAIVQWETHAPSSAQWRFVGTRGELEIGRTQSRFHRDSLE